MWKTGAQPCGWIVYVVFVSTVDVHGGSAWAGGANGGSSKSSHFGICNQLGDNMSYYNGHCYKVLANKIKFDEIAKRCEAQLPGSYMSEPKTQETLGFITNLVKSAIIDKMAAEKSFTSPNGYFIGGRRQSPTTDFKWLSNDEVMGPFEASMISSNWPNVAADNNCVAVNNNGKIDGRECWSTKFAVCQVGVDKICEASETYYDGYCYFTSSTDSADFEEQKLVCDQNNAKLVEIHSQDQYDFLQEYLFRSLWKTISSLNGKATDLGEIGISRKIGEKFCFGVKGIGNTELHFDGSHKDSCIETTISFERQQTDTSVLLTTCFCNISCLKEFALIIGSGHEWSHFCLDVDMASGTVSLEYNSHGEEGVLMVSEISTPMDDFVTDIKINNGDKEFLWKFPAIDTRPLSVYLGAVLSDNRWESGVTLNYSFFNITAPLPGSTHERLVFTPFPRGESTVSGNEILPRVCRKRWGLYNYYGVLPFDLYSSSKVILSHTTETTILINYAPYIGVVSSRTMIRNIPTDSELQMSSVFPVGYTGSTFFLIRADADISVEIFSFRDLFISSALVFPDLIGGKQFVIAASTSNRGVLTIINHELNGNDVTVYFPIYRTVYVEIKDTDVYYRPLVLRKKQLDEYENLKITFYGDISGTRITSTQRVSVFVATSPTNEGGNIFQHDIGFEQIFPTTKLTTTYPLFKTNLKYKLSGAQTTTDSSLHFSDETKAAVNSLTDNAFEVSITRPQVITINTETPFFVSFEIKGEGANCIATLIPRQFWKTTYSLYITHEHTAFHPQAVIITESDTREFVLDKRNVNVFCEKISSKSKYRVCSLGSSIGNDILLYTTGIHVITSSVLDEHFMLYLFGTNRDITSPISNGQSLACYGRPLGIKHDSVDINNTPFEQYVEPEECSPESDHTTIAPLLNITTAKNVETTVGPNHTYAYVDGYLNVSVNYNVSGNTINTTQITNETINTTSAEPPTPTTTPTPPPLPPHNPYYNVSMTMEEIEEDIREKTKEELHVDKKQMSSFTRKKISAPDDRTSSQGMGYVGIVMMTLVFGSMIVSDFVAVCKWTCKYISEKVNCYC